MAKSEIVTTKKPVVVETEVPTSIKLELTFAEAFIIRSLFGKVGGTGYLREAVDDVRSTLAKHLPASWQLSWYESEPERAALSESIDRKVQGRFELTELTEDEIAFLESVFKSRFVPK